MADTHSSLDYAPGIVPREANQLQEFLEIELGKIKSALDVLAAGHLDKIYAAPGRPRDGDIRYFDGTVYNPGSGVGIYYYNGSAWVFLG